jgi:DNA-binding response OmpR family regulator
VTKIVVVEDEAAIAEAVRARLSQEGFEVAVAGDGPSAVALCEKVVPDLVVLDLMLPGFDGLEVCRRIQEDRHVPVIMVTARDSETDVLVGLGVGADDYITKPFSMRELVARVHALLRRIERASKKEQPTTVMGDLNIDARRRKVTKGEEAVHLTAIEFDLLHHLASHSGAVFSREQLLRELWGYETPSGLRTVDSHIRALRRKLGPAAIRTVHGVGYAMGEAQ